MSTHNKCKRRNKKTYLSGNPSYLEFCGVLCILNKLPLGKTCHVKYVSSEGPNQPANPYRLVPKFAVCFVDFAKFNLSRNSKVYELIA